MYIMSSLLESSYCLFAELKHFSLWSFLTVKGKRSYETDWIFIYIFQEACIFVLLWGGNPEKGRKFRVNGAVFISSLSSQMETNTRPVIAQSHPEGAMHHGYLNFKALAQCATKNRNWKFWGFQNIFRYSGKTLKISGMHVFIKLVR